MIEKKKEFIQVDGAGIKRLREIFKVSTPAIYTALRFEVNTERAKKIRRVALMSKEDGGCGGVRYVAVED